MFVNVSSNLAYIQLQHISCPGARYCNYTIEPTNILIQTLPSSLYIANILPFYNTFPVLPQGLFQPQTIGNYTYYLGASGTTVMGFELFVVNTFKMLLVDSFTYGTLNSPFVCAAMSVAADAAFVFSSTEMVAVRNLSNIEGTIDPVQLHSSLLPYQAVADPYNPAVLFVVAQDRTQPFSTVNSLTYLNMTDMEFMISSRLVIPSSDECIALLVNPEMPNLLYAVFQNQSYFDVNYIDNRNLTLFKINITGYPATNATIITRTTISLPGYANAWAYDGTDCSLYYVTTAAAVAKFDLLGFTLKGVMTIWERNPRDTPRTPNTLMKFDSVTVSNGYLFLGSDWWGMLVKLKLSSFCDDHAACWNNLYPGGGGDDGPDGGAIAAAVIVPIVVVGAAVGGGIWWWRNKRHPYTAV